MPSFLYDYSFNSKIIYITLPFRKIPNFQMKFFSINIANRSYKIDIMLSYKISENSLFYRKNNLAFQFYYSREKKWAKDTQ